jgi:tetratricopeptide (TPR) repeat protein
MRRRLFSGNHPDTATNLNNVAACLNALGRHEDALAKFGEALAMFRALSSADQPNLANTMHNMAGCLNRLGRGAEALSCAEAAIEMNRRMLPPDHLHILLAQLNRARALTLLGRFNEAELALLEHAPKLLDRTDVAPAYRKRAVDEAVAFYEAWHAAEPGAGHDAQAAEWRQRLTASPPG